MKGTSKIPAYPHSAESIPKGVVSDHHAFFIWCPDMRRDEAGKRRLPPAEQNKEKS